MKITETRNSTWKWRAEFDSNEEFDAFQNYLKLIDVKSPPGSWKIWKITDKTAGPGGWGLSPEEYEAALEFNKIYGKADN